MRRDERLHGLSSDHHHALVLARRIRDAPRVEGAKLLAAVRQEFESRLAPHFSIEESLLLPSLAGSGGRALADRTVEEHRKLTGLLDEAAGNDAALQAFAALLVSHVRFEEDELFPVCEAMVPAAVLAEVARQAPKGGGE